MRSLLRRLAHLIDHGGSAIILVHGVFDAPPEAAARWNPVGKHLHIRDFSAAVAELSRHFRPIALDAALDGSASGFTLTFDDGYAGFESIILPVLERHQCPGIFFPVVNFVDGEPLWMDRVDHHLKDPDARRQWKSRLKVVSTPERDRLLNENFPVLSTKHEWHRAVDWGELRRLHAHPLVTIGNHTMSHPILARDDDATIRHEIGGAADRLRAELGTCRHFCYPNGAEGDHDARTKQVVADTGHDSALLSREARWHATDDPYLVTRFSLCANTFETSWFEDGVWGLRDLKQRLLG